MSKAVAIIGPKFKAWDPDTGLPLVGGKVYTYEAGDTTTNKTTYTDENQSAANTNPVILDANGEADIYLDGSYSIKVTDADDVVIYTKDPVTDSARPGQEWVNSTAASQYSASQFDLTGDLTDIFIVGRRARMTGATTLYGTITDTSYAAGVTRVTVDVDGGEVLTASLSECSVGILTRRGTTGMLGVSVALGVAGARAIDPADNEVLQLAYHSSAGDGGWGQFYGKTGEPAATYSDDGGGTLLPTGGDGSAAFLRLPQAIESVQGWGAKIDGATDDNAAITATKAWVDVHGSILYMPKGTYNIGGTTYQVDGPFLWLDHNFDNTVDVGASARNARILITTETSTDAVYDTTKNRIGVSVTAVARGGQHATAYRGTTNNYSTAGGGCTVFYGEARSMPGSWWVAAIHGETRHDGGTSIGFSAEVATYSDTGSAYGMVINNTTNGATTTHPVTGAAKADHPTSAGILIQGSATTDNMGAWKYGILFDSDSIKTGGTSGTGEGIRFTCAGAEHLIRSTTGAICATSDILLEGASPVGIILAGSYTNAGIRLNDGLYMAWKTDNTIKTRWNSANTAFEFENTGVLRAAINLSGTPHLDLAGTKVVGTRRTGWAAASGTATRTTFATTTVTVSELAERVKALIDDLTTHGLIGA